MSTSVSTSDQNRAILLMIAAIFCFSVMDMSVKALAPRVGVLPSLWVRYAGQMALVTILILPRFSRVVRTRYPKLQIFRSFQPRLPMALLPDRTKNCWEAISTSVANKLRMSRK